MRKGLIIRTIKTASGAKAVQIIRYARGKRVVVQHIGSAHTDEELTALHHKANLAREQIGGQLSHLPAEESQTRLMHVDYMHLAAVTHRFSYDAFRFCSQLCGLDWLPSLYQDIAIMRIIEPVSKLRTIELLNRYFNISHAERTVYRLLPKLIAHKEKIETAAYQTACTHFSESFALILYDVTTLRQKR